MPFDLSTASPVSQQMSAQNNGIPLSPQASEHKNIDAYNALPNHVKPLVNAVIEGRIPIFFYTTSFCY